MCPSAAYLYHYNNDEGNSDLFWKCYDTIPSKSGISAQHLRSLVWPTAFSIVEPDIQQKTLKNIRQSFAKMSPIFPEYISKFENTLTYLESLPSGEYLSANTSSMNAFA